MSAIVFPTRPRGRPSLRAQERRGEEVAAFCREILKINSTLDFRVSSRGWCYILEEHGLMKGNFDAAQRLINECRKSGDLPLDICSVDDGRTADGIQEIHGTDPEEEAGSWIDYVRDDCHAGYAPFAFWEDLDVYVEMLVEKIDLKSLFAPVCAEFYVPIANASGWNDINGRAAMMMRFKRWEEEGKHCVLLYCGDHDPGGLHISDFLHENLNDLAGAIDWSPDDLEIYRFGLNYDFIEQQRLTWIDNLETASGGRLDDRNHKDHFKPYVQDYLKRFGVRKVEANALVVRPEAGRDLCREAILQYIDEDAPAKYGAKLEAAREEMHEHVLRLLEAQWP